MLAVIRMCRWNSGLGIKNGSGRGRQVFNKSRYFIGSGKPQIRDQFKSFK